LQSYNLPAARARELLKPSTDSASRECFCIFFATFTWPSTQTHWEIILAQDFFGN